MTPTDLQTLSAVTRLLAIKQHLLQINGRARISQEDAANPAAAEFMEGVQRFIKIVLPELDSLEGLASKITIATAVSEKTQQGTKEFFHASDSSSTPSVAEYEPLTCDACYTETT